MASKSFSLRLPGIFLVVVLMLTLIASTVSCGRKEWPSPQIEQEKLAWDSVQTQRKEDCLQITAALLGPPGNLREVVLELEAAGTLCLDCPFQATSRQRFSRSSSGLQIENQQLQLIYCELDREMHYRIRLVALNVYPGLEPVSSRVIAVDQP